ncbi:hypothetical protein AYI69_g5130, partial [Smittium culicis]
MKSTFVFTNLSVALLVLSAQGFSLSNSYKSAKKSKEADTVYGEAGGNIPSLKSDPSRIGNYGNSENQNEENSGSGYYIINVIKNQSQKIKRYINSQQKNYESSKKPGYNGGAVQSADHQNTGTKRRTANGIHRPISSKVPPAKEQSETKVRYGKSPGNKEPKYDLVPEKPYKKAVHHSKRSVLNSGYPTNAKKKDNQIDIKGQDTTKQHTEYTNKINDSNGSFKTKNISVQGPGKPQENLYPVYYGAQKDGRVKNNQEDINSAYKKAIKSYEKKYRNEKDRQNYIKKRTTKAQKYHERQQKTETKDSKNYKFIKYSLRDKQQLQENRYNHRNRYSSKQKNKVNKQLGSNGASDNLSNKYQTIQRYNKSGTKNTAQRVQTEKKVASTKLHTAQKRQVGNVNNRQGNKAAVNQNDKNELINSLAEILKKLENVLDNDVLAMLPGLDKVIDAAKEAIKSVKDSAVDVLSTPTPNESIKPKTGIPSVQVPGTNLNPQEKNKNAQPANGSINPEKQNDTINEVKNPKLQQPQPPALDKATAALSTSNDRNQDTKDKSTMPTSPQTLESSNVPVQRPVNINSNVPAAQGPTAGPKANTPTIVPAVGSASPASPVAPPSMAKPNMDTPMNVPVAKRPSAKPNANPPTPVPAAGSASPASPVVPPSMAAQPMDTPMDAPAAKLPAAGPNANTPSPIPAPGSASPASP